MQLHHLILSNFAKYANSRSLSRTKFDMFCLLTINEGGGGKEEHDAFLILLVKSLYLRLLLNFFF